MVQGWAHLVFTPLGRWLVPGEEVMKKPTLSKPRKLKVQDVGDYYRREVIPQIKLQGKWLMGAGLQPDTHVQVTNPQSGVLIVKCLD